MQQSYARALREIRNPKFETRNKFKVPMSKTQYQSAAVGNLSCRLGVAWFMPNRFEFLHFHKFGFVSGFGFRVSGL